MKILVGTTSMRMWLTSRFNGRRGADLSWGNGPFLHSRCGRSNPSLVSQKKLRLERHVSTVSLLSNGAHSGLEKCAEGGYPRALASERDEKRARPAQTS